MKTALIPTEVLNHYRVYPRAVIDFLKNRNTVAVPRNPNELVEVEISTPHGPKIMDQERGYGYDCPCFGTGWIKGQLLCGRHIPAEPLQYIVKYEKPSPTI